MTSEDTATGNLSAIHDTLSSIPVYHDDPREWDAETLQLLAADDAPPGLAGDLRLETYDGQAVAALHGDPAVLRLDPYTQQRLTTLSYALDTLGEAHRHPWRDPAEYVRRAAAILTSGPGGTRLRCSNEKCRRVYHGMDGAPDWQVAGTEHTTCPVCTAAAPRHAAKTPAKPAAKAAAGTRRQRPSRARKTVTGGTS